MPALDRKRVAFVAEALTTVVSFLWYFSAVKVGRSLVEMAAPSVLHQQENGIAAKSSKTNLDFLRAFV
jgi:hypothetical protein